MIAKNAGFISQKEVQNWLLIYIRNFTIEKQLPRWIMKYTKCLSHTPTLLDATQIINPFF